MWHPGLPCSMLLRSIWIPFRAFKSPSLVALTNDVIQIGEIRFRKLFNKKTIHQHTERDKCLMSIPDFFQVLHRECIQWTAFIFSSLSGNSRQTMSLTKGYLQIDSIFLRLIYPINNQLTSYRNRLPTRPMEKNRATKGTCFQCSA